jgi:hypothetical protein
MKILELTNEEKYLTEQELFFKWLLDGKVNFIQLSQSYTGYLEKLKKDNNILIHSMSIPLASIFNKRETKSQKIFYKCKAAFNLIKTRIFNGTPFEKELKQLVKENEYSEDENGLHTIKTLK